MEVNNIALTTGRFIPSGTKDVEERLFELERYLILLTEELEQRSNGKKQ